MIWNDTATGLAIVRSALSIERYLDEPDLNPARLRLTQANLMQQAGASPEEVIPILIQGANLWFTRIGVPLIRSDFVALTTEMHDHFRLLSRTLLDSGRVTEAVLSFEAGRTLAHSIDVDRRFLERVVQVNPFASDGSAIDPTSLRRVQSSLETDEAFVSVAVLPPELVAFIVDRDRVIVSAVPMPTNLDELRALFAEIKVIPSRLQEREGRSAVPPPLQKLGSAIATSVGRRRIRSIAPYASLHHVPWRAVLRDAGLTWEQLAFRIEFSMLLRDARTADALPIKCVALGAGAAAGIDLGEEAREFAEPFRDSSVIVPCMRTDFELALQQEAVVFVSCHGIARDVTRKWTGLADGELVLHLGDGQHPAKEIISSCVKAPLVILSACESGVYQMFRGDFPVGAAPDLIRAGSKNCIGARFRLDARFSASFFRHLGQQLASGAAVDTAFVLGADRLTSGRADSDLVSRRYRLQASRSQDSQVLELIHQFGLVDLNAAAPLCIRVCRGRMRRI